ncbi:MAG: hypothetical protein Q9214_000660, partial [Letrouitia sp. 1 TL-2023]
MEDAQLPKKRLVICCDGTWNNSLAKDDDLTNVSRLSRSIVDIGEDGTLQIVYYHFGIGNGTLKIGNVIDGATGRGIIANVLHAYNFVCLNYNNVEDEIYLVGFSRGAYTAYVLASFISSIGLLTKTGLFYLHDVYGLWHQGSYNASGKVDMLDVVKEALKNVDFLRTNIKIEACAVWDTVSSLGLPAPAGIPKLNYTGYDFVDKAMPENVKNVFHGLALNEVRRDFKPILFTNPHKDTLLKQCWFLGAHSDVGGGSDDMGLANISLLWMIAQLQAHTDLEFDLDDLGQILAKGPFRKMIAPWIAIGRTKNMDNALRGLGARIAEEDASLPRKGSVYNSYKGIYHLSGAKDRLLGFLPAQLTSKVTASSRHSTIDKELTPGVDVATEQTIHFTVRLLLGKGFENAKCSVLKDCKTMVLPGDSENKRVVWCRNRPNTKTKSGSFLPQVSTEMEQIPEHVWNGEEELLLRLWAGGDQLWTKAEKNAKEYLANLLGEKGVQLDSSGEPEKDENSLANFLDPLLDEADNPTIMVSGEARESD